LEEIWKGIENGIHLLLSGNTAVYEILFLSLQVSLLAVCIGMLLGIPMGSFLGLNNFPGKGIIVNIIYTLMGLPPVIAGVIVYLFLSHSGPLGSLNLLFSPTAMVIAQVLLVTPIITGLSMVAIAGKEKEITQTAITLGASRLQVIWTVIKEARNAIIAAMITGFGRAIAEVGAVMLVGGNILHRTRVMTTSIVMETRQGNFDMALALGIILLILSFLINAFLQLLNRQRRSGNEQRHIYPS
jgi:tungstate transport system permease protein